MTGHRGAIQTGLVGLALVAIAAAAALSAGQVRVLPRGDALPPIPPAQGVRTEIPSPRPQVTVPPAVTGSGTAFDWVLRALLVLIVAAVLVGIAVVARRLAQGSRNRRLPDDGGELTAGLTAVERASRAVRSGLDDLDAPGTDPRGVVIGCWLALERAAAAAGLPRHDTDSPTDLVTRLLDGAAVPAPVLAELASLYRAARYAPDEVTDAGRDAARLALTEVAGALERRSTPELVAQGGPGRLDPPGGSP